MLPPRRFARRINRHALGGGQHMQIIDRSGPQAQRQKLGIARFGDVQERPAISAPTIEPPTLLKGSHAKIVEETAHLAQVGVRQSGHAQYLQSV